MAKNVFFKKLFKKFLPCVAPVQIKAAQAEDVDPSSRLILPEEESSMSQFPFLSASVVLLFGAIPF